MILDRNDRIRETCIVSALRESAGSLVRTVCLSSLPDHLNLRLDRQHKLGYAIARHTDLLREGQYMIVKQNA